MDSRADEIAVARQKVKISVPAGVPDDLAVERLKQLIAQNPDHGPGGTICGRRTYMGATYELGMIACRSDRTPLARECADQLIRHAGEILPHDIREAFSAGFMALTLALKAMNGGA